MDLGSMSVKDLRSIITERGFSTIGVLTRDELVARAEEAMAAPLHSPPMTNSRSALSAKPS